MTDRIEEARKNLGDRLAAFGVRPSMSTVGVLTAIESLIDAKLASAPSPSPVEPTAERKGQGEPLPDVLPAAMKTTRTGSTVPAGARYDRVMGCYRWERDVRFPDGTVETHHHHVSADLIDWRSPLAAQTQEDSNEREGSASKATEENSAGTAAPETESAARPVPSRDVGRNRLDGGAARDASGPGSVRPEVPGVEPSQAGKGEAEDACALCYDSGLCQQCNADGSRTRATEAGKGEAGDDELERIETQAIRAAGWGPDASPYESRRRTIRRALYESGKAAGGLRRFEYDQAAEIRRDLNSAPGGTKCETCGNDWAGETVQIYRGHSQPDWWVARRGQRTAGGGTEAEALENLLGGTGQSPEGPAVDSPAPPASPRWRTGRRVPRNLYLDDRDVGRVDTPELAAEIVAAMNGRGAEPSLAGTADGDVAPFDPSEWAVDFLHDHGITGPDEAAKNLANTLEHAYRKGERIGAAAERERAERAERLLAASRNLAAAAEAKTAAYEPLVTAAIKGVANWRDGGDAAKVLHDMLWPLVDALPADLRPTPDANEPGGKA